MKDELAAYALYRHHLAHRIPEIPRETIGLTVGMATGTSDISVSRELGIIEDDASRPYVFRFRVDSELPAEHFFINRRVHQADGVFKTIKDVEPVSSFVEREPC